MLSAPRLQSRYFRLYAKEREYSPSIEISDITIAALGVGYQGGVPDSRLLTIANPEENLDSRVPGGGTAGLSTALCTWNRLSAYKVQYWRRTSQ